MKKTASSHKKWLEKHGHWVHFTHRDRMRRKAEMAKAVLPAHLRAVPPTTLPVDCTGNATVSCPMDANDTLGICGPAMCDHVDGIRSYGQGKAGFSEVHANLSALESQYEQVSGGDNGTDEDMLVGPNGIWLSGIAGDASCVVVDHLDVDMTDAPLVQYCHDQFYSTCMAWSVPDRFLQEFQTGASFLSPMTPDPQNGHYTPLSDVDKDGNYRLWSWGTWCWVSPSFVGSVDPQSFVTFSPLQFQKASGYDSHGRHVSDQADKWVALGGNAAKVAAVVAMFPPKPAPAPTPPGPAPTSNPPLAPVLSAIQNALNGAPALEDPNQVMALVTSAITPLYPPGSP